MGKSKKKKPKPKLTLEQRMAQMRGSREIPPSGTDALARRAPGSYESGKRR